MKDQTTRRSLRSAIYTRVSTEQGLEQDFNSLDAQREACEAYIKSQAQLARPQLLSATKSVMKQCGAQWQSAKAAGTTNGATWPQFLK